MGIRRFESKSVGAYAYCLKGSNLSKFSKNTKLKIGCLLLFGKYFHMLCWENIFMCCAVVYVR